MVFSNADEIAQLRQALKEKEDHIQELETKIASALRTLNEGSACDVKDLESQDVFRFMDLPIEIRNMVYELCLAMGVVHIRPRGLFETLPRRLRQRSKLEWQLLMVSSAVRSEAMKILLEKNHFVLSHEAHANSEFFLLPDDGEWDSSRTFTLSQYVHRYLRSASISLDLRLHADNPLELAISTRHGLDISLRVNNKKWTAMTLSEQLYYDYDTTGNFSLPWSSLCESLCHARYLEIDITNAYGPTACHRWIGNAALGICNALRPDIAQTFVISGTKSAAERRDILSCLAHDWCRLGSENEKHVVRFKAQNIPDIGTELSDNYLAGCDLEEDQQDEEVDLNGVKEAYWDKLWLEEKIEMIRMRYLMRGHRGMSRYGIYSDAMEEGDEVEEDAVEEDAVEEDAVEEDAVEEDAVEENAVEGAVI